MLKLPKISLGRSYSPLIGLDITTSSIKLIELAQSPELVVFHNGRLTREPRHWSHWRPAPPLGVMFRVVEPADLAEL